jgi:hypothetical protein
MVLERKWGTGVARRFAFQSTSGITVRAVAGAGAILVGLHCETQPRLAGDKGAITLHITTAFIVSFDVLLLTAKNNLAIVLLGRSKRRNRRGAFHSQTKHS